MLMWETNSKSLSRRLAQGFFRPKHQIRGEERNDIISPYFPYGIPILVVSYVESK